LKKSHLHRQRQRRILLWLTTLIQNQAASVVTAFKLFHRQP